MSHNEEPAMDNVALRCPPLDRIRAKAAMEWLQKHMPCNCVSCCSLEVYLDWLVNNATEEELKAYFVLKFHQAAKLLVAMQRFQSDYMLEYASRLCQAFGTLIMYLDTEPKVKHELEQAHAATRNRIEHARLCLCFQREFHLHGVICDAYINRALELVLPAVFEGEFGGIEFDTNLHKRVSQNVTEMIRQLRGVGP